MWVIAVPPQVNKIIIPSWREFVNRSAIWGFCGKYIADGSMRNILLSAKAVQFGWKHLRETIIRDVVRIVKYWMHWNGKISFVLCNYGGGGGIRTHGRLSPTSVFKTGAFNHSATPPTESWVLGFWDVIKGLSEKFLTNKKVKYLTLWYIGNIFRNILWKLSYVVCFRSPTYLSMVM